MNATCKSALGFLRKILIVTAFMALLLSNFSSCTGKKAAKAGETIRSLAVFVPGAAAGSPLYEQMVDGARRSCEENGVTFTAYEAGFNQAEWGERLTGLAASGKWDIIVSSNPSIPALCLETLKVVPGQRFLVADGYLSGNKNIHTVLYNQVEQAYSLGYFAGLYSQFKDPAALSVGVVVAQRYPSLDQAILPGFEAGLRDAAPNMGIDVRLVGNWYDAAKAMELSKALLDSGAQVLFPIAGGAAQGVITAAKDKGRSVVWFDSSNYSLAPGTILACSLLRQEKLIYERVTQAIKGQLVWGEAEILSMKDGYVDFDDNDELYSRYVPEELRAKMGIVVAELRSGKKSLPTPTF